MEQPAATITTIVDARGVTREFRSGGGVVHALRGIDLRILPGEFVALRGRSGSGKTTLLNILAYDTLKRVGLAKRAHHRGLELSGGEQQRVALARALVHSPRFIVADEPTGNLDSVTGRDIATLLRETAQQSQIGLLVATHDATIVEAADRVLSIQDGRIVD